jgi:superfamily II DNA/RNA helicase
MTSSGLNRAVGIAFYGAYQGLRPAQQRAVEAVLGGEDVVVLAGTGSGKTEAVMAPMVTCTDVLRRDWIDWASRSASDTATGMILRGPIARRSW